MRMEYYKAKERDYSIKRKRNGLQWQMLLEGLNKRRAKLGYFYFNEWMSLTTLLRGISWHDRSRSQIDLD